MGKIHPTIDDSIREFIDAQPLFFVATAPLDSAGHVNVSPKGLDTFRVLGPTIVAYLDLTGSGIETVSHLKENGRIVLMFCAFQGSPKILRLHGRGKVVEPGENRFRRSCGSFSGTRGKPGDCRDRGHPNFRFLRIQRSLTSISRRARSADRMVKKIGIGRIEEVPRGKKPNKHRPDSRPGKKAKIIWKQDARRFLHRRHCKISITREKFPKFSYFSSPIHALEATPYFVRHAV